MYFHDLVRHFSICKTPTSALEGLTLHTGSAASHSFVTSLISEIQPDEVYNLAAQSHVDNSWQRPIETCETNCLSLVNLLDGIRVAGLEKRTRIFQAWWFNNSAIVHRLIDTPGRNIRALWTIEDPNPKREHSIYSDDPLCNLESICSLDCCQL
jgi:hypothetical protein